MSCFQESGLDKVGVSRDCVRLVRYDSLQEAITESFEGKAASAISSLFPYLSKPSGHEMLLEHKLPCQQFAVYKPGGKCVCCKLAQFLHNL
jgi:hypothetical protein